MDAGVVLAEYIVETGYGDIPDEAVKAAKRDILDTLGVAVAGSSRAGGREIVELVKEWGGKEESTILMHDLKAPCPYAALVNGTMAHALDYDDADDASVLHAGVTVVPAAFATAEKIGRVNGRDILTAVTLGVDIACRLGRASKKDPSELGWIFTPVCGIFGAAAASGKLMNLNKQQMVNAFGIAYSQAAGNFQCVIDGALSKRLQAGFAAGDGVMSALMASKGLTGAQQSLEGEKGLFQVYYRGEYDPRPLTAELGKHFAISELTFKPYPCCRGTHAAIDATLVLVNKHDITVGDVEEISVRTGEANRLLCEPLEAKQKPRTHVDAQFSIPWTVATAVVKRKVTLDDFTPEAIIDPVVCQVAAKVRPQIESTIGKRGTPPTVVTVRAKNAVFTARVDIPKGHPAKPLGWKELCDKFVDCAHRGAKPLPQSSIDKAVSMLTDLDKVKDITQILELFA